jgi:hypothetical protein
MAIDISLFQPILNRNFIKSLPTRTLL